MMGVGFFGLAVVVGMLVAAWVRRDKRGIGRDTEGPKAGERTGWFVVVIGGVIVPIGVIVALFVVSDIFMIRTTEAPAATATKMTVLVVGHQFWWEIRYPGTPYGHGERDACPGPHPRAGRGADRRRDPQLLGPGAEPEDPDDPGTDERDRVRRDHDPGRTSVTAPSSAGSSTRTCILR